ncbi:activating signal cointegrator 1 complex subunit 2 homolog, partial [Rhincodon typus]|uniref:activating signal cointegrator 1 complex subunit 2 homolog n=1 Tax=Rhincodon typus TaxID=259920 RepID=UPI00202E34B1
MSDANKVPRSSDRNQPSNKAHRERRYQNHSSSENNYPGKRSREDRRDYRESHQSKPHPSRQSYPPSERHDPHEEYTRHPGSRVPSSHPNSHPSSSSPPYYSSPSQTNPPPPKESFGTKCSYMCSRRDLSWLLAAFSNSGNQHNPKSFTWIGTISQLGSVSKIELQLSNGR